MHSPDISKLYAVEKSVIGLKLLYADSVFRALIILKLITQDIYSQAL